MIATNDVKQRRPYRMNKFGILVWPTFVSLSFLLIQQNANASYYVPAKSDCEVAFVSVPESRALEPRLSTTLKDVDRKTNPTVGVMFQNLVALNHPTDGANAIQLVQEQVGKLKGFASAFFMGPVYPQTVLEHEAPDGKVYENTGYYWPQTFAGVDPTLGTKGDYFSAVDAARANGLSWIQDIGMTYMGYPAQNPKQLEHYKRILSMQGVTLPSNAQYTETAYFMGDWRNINDTTYFMQRDLHDPKAMTLEDAFRIYEDSSDPSVNDYRTALEVIRTSELFGLKRMNTDNTKVLDQIISDHLWYIREAKVTQFRLDAAKHMRPATIRYVVDAFTREVQNYVSSTVKPSFYLEFWTQKYRNMRYFLNELGDTIPQLYFYDYPLGMAIRSAVLLKNGYYDGFSGFEGLKSIIDKRREFRIKTQELIPLWVDHDFLVPVYDGTEKSIAQLAAGYTLAFMMSANLPHVYNGIEKPQFWRDPQPPVGQFVQPARNPIDNLIDTTSKPFAVLQSLIAKMTTPENRQVITESEDIFINSISPDHVVLERRLDNQGHKIIARVSRSSDPGYESNGRVIWEYIGNDMSVRIYAQNY